MGIPERRTRDIREAGNLAAEDAATEFMAPASYSDRTFLRKALLHPATLRGRTIPRRCALPCILKTAHFTSFNRRIQVESECMLRPRKLSRFN